MDQPSFFWTNFERGKPAYFISWPSEPPQLQASSGLWVQLIRRLPIPFLANFFLNLHVRLFAIIQYRWTWIWRTTVWQIFAYDGRYAWSQSDAYQVFVICIRWILHMTDQFSWSHCVRHIQVHLYISISCCCSVNPVTGRWEEYKPDPMEGMSEEQKEYEAVQLVNKLDKLMR